MSRISELEKKIAATRQRLDAMVADLERLKNAPQDVAPPERRMSRVARELERRIARRGQGRVTPLDDRRPYNPRPPAVPTPPPPLSDPRYRHPGHGWGPVDDAGISKHLLCGGRGSLKIADKIRKCEPCNGDGCRRCGPVESTLVANR